MNGTIGHNSVQIPHNGFLINVQERKRDWAHFDMVMARRNRARLIRNGTITPPSRMKPQMLVRNPDVAGGWSPEIKRHG